MNQAYEDLTIPELQQQIKEIEAKISKLNIEYKKEKREESKSNYFKNYQKNLFYDDFQLPQHEKSQKPSLFSFLSNKPTQSGSERFKHSNEIQLVSFYDESNKNEFDFNMMDLSEESNLTPDEVYSLPYVLDSLFDANMDLQDQINLHNCEVHNIKFKTVDTNVNLTTYFS